MQRIAALSAGMLTAAILTVSCGASSDSAIPGAQARPAQAGPSSSASASSTASASASASSTASASSSSASSSSASSSSASSSNPPAPPVLGALADFGAPVYEPDVPTWPTMSCQNLQEGAPDDGEGTGQICMFNQSPTSFEYYGVGYQYVQGDSGPYHAILVCQCNHGGADLGVAKGGTSSEALDWSGNIIVGYGDAADGVTHALYWANASGPAITLPLPSGTDPQTRAEAHAVNSSGEIVGVYWLANDPQNVGTRAVLWEPDANAADGTGYLAYDLTSLLPASASGLVLGTAYGIDCTGDVAADGTPAKWQRDPQSAALQSHRYLAVRQGGNGASCTP